jgi:hypothetical protein
MTRKNWLRPDPGPWKILVVRIIKYLVKKSTVHCSPPYFNLIVLCSSILTVTMLKPMQSPRIPPEFATNQIKGIFWSLLKVKTPIKYLVFV